MSGARPPGPSCKVNRLDADGFAADIDHPTGSVHVECRDGNMSATLPVIRSVGLLDLSEVLSHQVNHVFGSVSHVVHLVNGGVVRYAFSAHELIELSGYGVRAVMDREGCIRFGAYREPDREQP